MKHFPLVLSRTFPQWHPRAGRKTFFKSKLENAHVVPYDPMGENIPDGQPSMKLHTIRGNYERWARIFEEINKGAACIELRQWSGVPYRSKQETIAVLTKEDGIGLQKLEFEHALDIYWCNAVIRNTIVEKWGLALNDGLSYDDWRAWFENADLSEPMAIIHFTKFRY